MTRPATIYSTKLGYGLLKRKFQPHVQVPVIVHHERRKHRATRLLRQIPDIGPLRAARLVAVMQTPYRFRTKLQLWTYRGLGLETHDSAQWRVEQYSGLRDLTSPTFKVDAMREFL